MMTAPWPVLRWEDYQAVVMGPGLSRQRTGRNPLAAAPGGTAKGPGCRRLESAGRAEGWWQHLRGPAVLTPHLGEMARLCRVSPDTVRAERLDLVREKARQWGVVLVLKDAVTLVAPPEGAVYINPTGNSGLATGGTGDVLAGVIGGLLAQGLSPEKAAVLGVYLHGAAGDLAAAELGAAGMIAGDLLEELALVIKRGTECGKI